MKKALVFIEFDKDGMKKSALECLSALQGGSFEIATVACGAGADSLKDKLGSWGVSKHFVASDGGQYNPETYQNILQKAVDQFQPSIILASSNNHGRDVFPRIAAKNDMAYMSDITDLEGGENLTVKRPLYAGKCMAQVTFTDDSARILLLRPNQIAVVEPQGSATTEVVTLSADAPTGSSETLKIEKGESEKLDLTEAEIIVSGGRGLKEAENFKLLNDLAEPLNATVGASRAVVDLGWVPHSLQVGQTGKTVAPVLYFAVGISGAIQHLAGMSGSRNIVAINKDEKAPIFQKATYGIVGDLFEVVPKLTEKLKSIR